jgi:hypothetical protein
MAEAFQEARMKRFAERYDALVAETGMMLVPVLESGPRGIYPSFAILPKKPQAQAEEPKPEETPAEEPPKTE